MANGEAPGETRRVALALENDLFFAVKVTDILKRAGFQTQVARTLERFRESLATAGAVIALVNTAARGLDWQAGIALARAAGLPVVAYAPHVDIETQTVARAAGANRVIANSRLADLVAIVERVVARAYEADADAETDEREVQDE